MNRLRNFFDGTSGGSNDQGETIRLTDLHHNPIRYWLEV